MNPFEAWKLAREGNHKPTEWAREKPTEHPPSPRFESAIDDLNIATRGGLYGITGLGGEPGTGKSMFAMASALGAAYRTDTSAVYVAAEMTRSQIESRLIQLAATLRIPRDELDRMYGNRFSVLYVTGSTPWHQLSRTIEALLFGADRSLLVLDSINALLDFMGAGERDYWREYQQLVEHLVAARHLSDGSLCILALSELNAAGASKGRKLEYKADLMLDFKNDQTPKVIKLKVVKSREAGDSGPLGRFIIMPDGRFQRLSQVEPEPAHPGEW